MASTKELFIDRVSINKIVNPNNEKVFFDHHFAENILYGVVDEDSNVVVPNTNKLVTLKEQEGTTHQVLNFVQDMFVRIKTNLRLKQALNRVSRDNPDITKFKIRKAYDPPAVRYESYLENIVLQFEAQFNDGLTNYNITSFDNYVKQFYHFLLNNLNGVPVTYGEWLKSSNNSIFSTGLAISIANIDPDDNVRKIEFVNTECFKYFKRICLNEGFHILENSPWVMLANISSPKTLEMLKKYNYFNDSLIINNNIYFNNISNIEYLYIKNILINRYNIYVTNNPLILDYKVYGKRKTIQQQKYRRLYDINGRYTDNFWIDYFLRMKNIERPIYNDKQLAEIDDYRKKIEKIFDRDTGLGYINIIFREKYKSDAFCYRFLFDRFRKEKRLRELATGITRGSVNLGSSGGSSGGY